MASQRLIDLVGDVMGLLDVEEFRQGLLEAVPRAVACDWISLNDLSSNPAETVVLIEPPFPPQAHEVFAVHAADNPLLQAYQRTGDGRAYRFSDVCSREELRATSLYQEFYAPIDLEHQIAFTLPHERRDRVLALALSRKRQGRNFSDAERDLLDAARPFLIQSYSNAIEHSRLRAELSIRAISPPLPIADPELSAKLRARGVTRRQAEVLSLVATGATDREVARSLGLSERTVQKHLQLCYAALEVHSRTEAVELVRDFAARSRP
jgi:DNA-binding CsgD family transcriptional regulator